MSYGMYTDEGDEAVGKVMSEILTEANLPKDKDDEEAIMKLVEEISKRVILIGQGQTNLSKYSTKNIEGFEEVCDTVVRDKIYETIYFRIADDKKK
jgi:uncharacterized protein YfkK (UPF0435 family)